MREKLDGHDEAENFMVHITSPFVKKSFKFGQKWLFVGGAKRASEQPRNCGFKSRQWYFKPTHVPKKGSSCGSVGRAVSSVNRGTRVQIEL